MPFFKWPTPILALSLLLTVLTGTAHAELQTGVAYGLGQLQSFSALQGSTALKFRLDLPVPLLSATIDLESRSQAMSPERTYVYETNGLALGLMAKMGWFRVGTVASGTWFRAITTDDRAAGTLKFDSKPGLIVEPYLAVAPPFARLGNAQIEFSIHYPVVNWMDPAISPRVMVSLWGAGNQTGATPATASNKAIDDVKN